jgi:tripartite-type tricarboxylate transporter receptor subunit TctC
LTEIPTAVEAGYPSLEFDGLVGLFGPPGIADDVRARIAADVRTVAKDPGLIAKLAATTQVVSPCDAAEFAASIEQQKAKIAAIAKLFGNKPVH